MPRECNTVFWGIAASCRLIVVVRCYRDSTQAGPIRAPAGDNVNGSVERTGRHRPVMGIR